VQVRIGEEGFFEAEDDMYRGPGRAGVYLFGAAEIRKVWIDGRRFPTQHTKDHNSNEGK
jgi:hypothetical protein